MTVKTPLRGKTSTKYSWMRAIASMATVWLATTGALHGGETNLLTTPLQRGEYLVERVAMCADCHTARNWKGEQDRQKWLRGAKLDFKPTRSMPWATYAPDIAGLPMFKTDAEAVTFFEAGTNAAGKSPRPPMPQRKLTRADAEAVVTYLRSLKPAEK